MAMARDRVRLVEMHHEMATESPVARPAVLKVVDANGSFDPQTFALINAGFEQQFHYPLPVTANGQTAYHESVGLDHRGKMDVGVNPQKAEGIWLRHFLEGHQIPYIAYRADHFHIGTGCARIVHLADAKPKVARLTEVSQVAKPAVANEEQNLEHSKAIVKFDGNGHFDTTDFAVIATEFEQQFHTQLPVTARGQTALHQSLGLDHHGRVDVV